MLFRKSKKCLVKSARLLIVCSLLFAGFTGFVNFSLEEESNSASVVHVLKVDNSIITPVSAEFIMKAIKKAEEENVHCLIVQLDTPGGAMEAMRDITKSFLAAEIPIIVYVYPPGARAASAGVWITYAAHIAAMAPSTNIGAAHPVAMGGKADSSVIGDKVINDAVASVKALAEKRGRNIEWAERAVRESVSITETEALELNVIDFIAPTLDSLLAQIDGEKVELPSGEMTLNTKNARIVYREMNFRYRVLEKLANPNVAYIFMMLGIYGLFFELSNPGAIFPGAVGAIFLIIAFYALQMLPVNYAGLLLIALAIVLFILEVKVTSFGMLTIGGIISMTLGSLMLIDQPSDQFAPAISISISLIIGVVTLTAAFFIIAFGLAFRTHRRKVTTGNEGLIDQIGTAQFKISPEGNVFVHGEIWKAYSEEPINKGEKIRVIAVEGLTLKVEKLS